jgi:hypothetical protein
METVWLGDGVADNHKVCNNHKVRTNQNEVLDFDESFGHVAGIGGKKNIYTVFTSQLHGKILERPK